MVRFMLVFIILNYMMGAGAKDNTTLSLLRAVNYVCIVYLFNCRKEEFMLDR